MKSYNPFLQISLVLLAFFFCFITNPLTSKACTVFNKSSEGTVLFGNVENEAPQYVAELHFNPPDESKGHFGNFFVYYNGNVAGGMNDQGLCFDVAALPSHPAGTGKPHGDLVSYLLEQCATVDDALKFFSNYYWPGHNVNHLMIMDKSGASVVVELIGSTLYIFNKEGNSQVMTNFSFADPEIRYGDYPCDRFNTANSMLDTMALTVDNAQKVCKKVSHAYYNALYANVYNPNTLEIHFFNANIYNSNRTTFNLIDEYNKGSHHYILKNNQIISGLSEIAAGKYSVSDNYPNPFYTKTSFTLNLLTDANVKINILDVHGQSITTLENGKKYPGSYIYNWQPASLPKGIYFCRINVDGMTETRKWLRQ